MRVNKCDMCKEIETQENLVRSSFKITYTLEMNMAEDWEKPRYELVNRTERFDLCEKCARGFYKIVTGRAPLKKVI